MMSQTMDLALEEEVMSDRNDLDFSLPIGENDSASRREAALVAVGRRASQTNDEHALMRDAAGLLAETLDLDYCGVIQQPAGSPKKRFWLGPTKHVSEGGSGNEIELRATDTGSMAAYAMASQHVIVTSDLPGESRFIDLFLREQGIRCGIVCPLVCHGRTYGAVGVFGTQPRAFDKSDVVFVDAITSVLSTTMAHQQACHELDERQRFEEAVLETIDAMILELTLEGKIISSNRTCTKVTGFLPAELEGRAIWSAFLVPEEMGVITGAFDRLREGETPVEFDSFLLAKHGDRRRIAWSFSILEDPQTRQKKLIGTGVDVTEHHEVAAELATMRAAAEEAKESLGDVMAKIDSGESDPEGSQPFERLPDGIHEDRRNRARRSYPYVQLIAPVIENKQPLRTQFREVRCRDIAAGGFSYLSPVEPDFEELVIGFGTAPAITYLKAKIVHLTTLEVGDQTQYYVGCSYTGRVEY